MAVVADIVRRSPFTEPTLGRGRSIAGFFTPTLKKGEFEVVLGALERIEHEEGATAVFENRQLNFIIAQWRVLLDEPKRIT